MSNEVTTGKRPGHKLEHSVTAARCSLLTTNIRPRSFTRVYFRVYLSYLYVGLLEVLTVGRTFSSIKTSLIRLLTAVAPIDEVVRDQRTTPDVVKTSKASNMTRLSGADYVQVRQQRDAVQVVPHFT